jgi:hypothetical protein
LSQSYSSPTRRWLLVGVLLGVAAIVFSFAERDRRPAPPVGGEFSGCARLQGDDARECYRREVRRELIAVGGAGPRITFSAPAGDAEVTFTSAAESDPLLCDLHARVGVVDADVPGWTEPTISQTAPQS